MAKSKRVIFSLSEETKRKLGELAAHHGEPASGVIRLLIKRAWNEMQAKERPK